MRVRLPIGIVAAFCCSRSHLPTGARSDGRSPSRSRPRAPCPTSLPEAASSSSGAVRPHVSGLALSLQQRHGAGWYTIGAATAGANGAFSFTTHPKTPGFATYRVAAKGTGYTGDSSPVPVQIVHWSYLSNVFVQMPRGTGESNTDAVKADGVTYQYPVALDAGCYNAWNGSAWITYDLGKSDEALKATVAIADDALPGTTAPTR